MGSEDDAEVLARLQAQHPGWKLWRPRYGHGRLWCGTRLDADAGTDPTLIENSAEDLDKAIRRQARRVMSKRGAP